MMVVLASVKKFFGCRRVGTLSLLSVWLVLCYFSSLEYGTALFRLRTKSFLKPRKFDILPSLWILPRGEFPNNVTYLRPPNNWTILASLDVDQAMSCRSCYNADVSINSLMKDWASRQPSGSASSARVTLERMAEAVTALKHGAVGVLMTSDLSSLNKSMSRLLLDTQPDGARGIEYYGERLTQASFHFLHRSSISHENHCAYRLRRRMNPLWTVGVRCQASNVKVDGESLTLIDFRSPPIFTPTSKFSISDYSDAFFDYDGLWAMFPSFMASSLDVSIWGLWAQRLLQEIGGHMAITSLHCPKHVQTMKTFSEPGQKTLQTFQFIRNWQCSVGKSFFECALTLAQMLLEEDFVKPEDFKLLGLWFRELKKSHYVEPRRRSDFNRSSASRDLLLGCIIHSPARVLQETNVIERANHFPNIFPFCKNLPRREGVVYPFQNHQLIKSRKVEDIALVIIFYDASIYANIQFLQELYSKYFPHIIYCGPGFDKFYTVYRSLKTPLSYIEVPDTKGFVAYECVSRAIMMNYDVNGYIEIADDVILNTWSLGNIPRDRFWFQKQLKTASRHQQIMNDFALTYPFPWWPWTVHGQMWGAKAMSTVWKRFESIQTLNNTKSKEMVTGFLKMLQHNSGAYDKFFYSSSDIFYVPSKFRQSWAFLSDIFFSNNVFLDIAVPTMMNGMDYTTNIIRMEGVYLWYNERGNYPAHYRNYHQFFHPWKMGWIHRSDHANFLCFHILPNIVNDLMAKKFYHDVNARAFNESRLSVV